MCDRQIMTNGEPSSLEDHQGPLKMAQTRTRSLTCSLVRLISSQSEQMPTAEINNRK